MKYFYTHHLLRLGSCDVDDTIKLLSPWPYDSRMASFTRNDALILCRLFDVEVLCEHARKNACTHARTMEDFFDIDDGGMPNLTLSLADLFVPAHGTSTFHASFDVRREPSAESSLKECLTDFWTWRQFSSVDFQFIWSLFVYMAEKEHLCLQNPL